MVDSFNKKSKINDEREINQKFLLYECVIVCIALISFITLIFAAEFAIQDVEWKVGMILIAFVELVVACAFGIKIETEVGFYECKQCGHRHVPKYSTVLWAPHIGRTRYMKCPKCQEKSWQKKRLTKKED